MASFDLSESHGFWRSKEGILPTNAAGDQGTLL